MGRAVDEDGEIIDKTGNVIGRAERYTPEEEPEPELSPEEAEKQQKEKEDTELAKKMCTILQQTIDSVGPICKEITQVSSLVPLSALVYHTDGYSALKKPAAHQRRSSTRSSW
jgi:hypothetical protein